MLGVLLRYLITVAEKTSIENWCQESKVVGLTYQTICFRSTWNRLQEEFGTIEEVGYAKRRNAASKTFWGFSETNANWSLVS